MCSIGSQIGLVKIGVRFKKFIQNSLHLTKYEGRLKSNARFIRNARILPSNGKKAGMLSREYT